MSDPESNKKLYHSIGEVAEMLKVNQSLIRYWEKEFPALAPKKNRSGRRMYSRQDINHLRMIYSLVKEKGMKLDGARQVLQSRKKKVDNTLQYLEIFERIKDVLVDMRKALDEEKESHS